MDLKNFIKKIIPRRYLNSLRKLIIPEKLVLMDRDIKSLFLHQYKFLGNTSQKDDLRNHEFSIYSKVGEDGLISYIFSKIGVANHRFVELGIQDGKECNTANLSLNFGWQGMLVDVKEEFIESAKSYYRQKLGKEYLNVKVVLCFVTAENINKLLLDNGIKGEIDLLSIDIDGNDYWVWKAINEINPRLAVVEYNTVFGPDKALAIKYRAEHLHGPKNPLYYGASLAALCKLADSKGYILVGCDSEGHDAFFVRKDLAEGKFQELSPQEAFYPMKHFLKKFGSIEQQFELVKHLDFEHI